MFTQAQDIINEQLAEIKHSGLHKAERILTSAQQAYVRVADQKQVLNMCANNYLGLADDARVIEAVKVALDQWGFGCASVRFICGTQQPHRQLEAALSAFLGTQDTILYSSCFDANGGLFETLLTADDAIISDQLNHASIIDGVRLCKAKRFRYANNDMTDLEKQLVDADEQGARIKLITTDGVFSMDGILANLPAICDLAEKYKAIVMVDDSHATGFVGKTGRGTHEHFGVMDRIDILTGTLGKALGGASGGYISGHQAVIDLLRQRSRPYLFSNSVAPPVVAGSLKVLEILKQSTQRRDKLASNTQYFRQGMAKRGFDIVPGAHPICPIMLGDARLAAQMAEAMLNKGVYVIGFSYPVVPKDKARIRVQVSAAHSTEDLNMAMDAFAQVKKDLAI
ncbi:MAG: glycine C-acetyltransferase [Phycisphaeraceae bacterium]|nr:glycine C-acetyltransferase [Phycisphaeraceae bacterium]